MIDASLSISIATSLQRYHKVSYITSGKHNVAEFQAARDNTALRISECRGAIHAVYFSVPFSVNARTRRRFCQCSDLSTVSFERPPRPTAFHASHVSYPALSLDDAVPFLRPAPRSITAAGQPDGKGQISPESSTMGEDHLTLKLYTHYSSG